jgi:hypothetical protein
MILDLLVELLGRIITCKYTKQLVKDKVIDHQYAIGMQEGVGMITTALKVQQELYPEHWTPMSDTTNAYGTIGL